MNNNVNVRSLNTSDMIKVSKIMAKSFNEAVKSTEGLDVDDGQFGLAIVTQLLAVNEKEVIEFFASLTGETVEEFKERPPSYIFDVIDAVYEKEGEGGLKDFFYKAKSLVGKFTNTAQKTK